MRLLNFLKTPDINAGLAQFSAEPRAVLLDVRTQEEYAKGRIPQSKNLPLHEIDKAAQVIPDFTTPIFVYCLSGARSRQAVAALSQMGYENVTNIGGINEYYGKMEG